MVFYVNLAPCFVKQALRINDTMPLTEKAQQTIMALISKAYRQAIIRLAIYSLTRHQFAHQTMQYNKNKNIFLSRRLTSFQNRGTMLIVLIQ